MREWVVSVSFLVVVVRVVIGFVVVAPSKCYRESGSCERK
jgi:hypothetical protein